MLKALGLYTFIKIKKKKAQLVTDWPGFSLHFKEMTYIIFIMNQKGTSYIFPSIIHIYRTYAFMMVYLPACFTNADILIDIYIYIYAENIYRCFSSLSNVIIYVSSTQRVGDKEL